MNISLFITFKDNCQEAIAFYAKIFNTKVQDLMTFGQMPTQEGFVIPEEDREKVVFATLNVYGTTLMFSDRMSGQPWSNQGNINVTLRGKEKDELQRLYAELQVGGKVLVPMQPTFWSDLFGIVQDKFGTTWQLSHDATEA
ncbi:VOC family protein [Entomospira culicis]|uniref:VOC family protein n=1 Tax=Entomospira culicis TaxID=2719989 RepID=A0A968GI21_9SPIO|nr:VOC family protein [Entomospira culicis]NIZ18800.1 VOC family protein [Entomospira culicis]NIZ69015.1 VOC family protein [Entomospira culicis]WDI37605.1 VOC family protein [Entomospira culicis]WDI39233.1 VOC family protein [Entomospira culicis]